MYPRTISIYRLPLAPAGSAGFGAQPYQEPQTASGASVWASAPIFSGIQCSIQEYRSGQHGPEPLPGDTPVIPTTKIFVPAKFLALGTVQYRDYILDDIGLKYAVINPYWNSLGYRLYSFYLEM